MVVVIHKFNYTLKNKNLMLNKIFGLYSELFELNLELEYLSLANYIALYLILHIRNKMWQNNFHSFNI
jgi:hypothetical protein